MKFPNLMIIGVGFHAERIYLPILFKQAEKRNFHLRFGVDLESKREDVQKYLAEKKFDLEMIYLKDFDNSKGMPREVEAKLSELVRENHIDGVIISTEPLAHKDYALWALRMGLNILMDKPISTRKGVAHNMKAARGIVEDYQTILNAYLKLQKEKQTIFSINVQRRYELGYRKSFELINEVRERFNAPITSIQAMHSDGVWIFPDEIVDQNYHPYNLGFGKGSHSGYHIFDIVWKFYEAGLIEGKAPDRGELFSSFLNPDGLLTQFSHVDYERCFGRDAYDAKSKRDHKVLKKIYKSYGEIDIFSVIRLLKGETNICNISLNLLHNSFSRRSWAKPSVDLYKGNGRVKHQYYNIQQGPFQCIQIHNFQSNDIHDSNTLDDYKLGGNNHFDIYIFRNAAMFGRGEKALRVLNLKDLDEKSSFQDDKLYNETAKEGVISEFLNFLEGDMDIESMKSNITSHSIPARIMSAIYESNVKLERGGNPLVKFDIIR